MKEKRFLCSLPSSRFVKQESYTNG